MKMSLRKKRIQRIPKGTFWEFSWQPWVGGAGKEGNICLNGINDRKMGQITGLGNLGQGQVRRDQLQARFQQQKNEFIGLGFVV